MCLEKQCQMPSLTFAVSLPAGLPVQPVSGGANLTSSVSLQDFQYNQFLEVTFDDGDVYTWAKVMLHPCPPRKERQFHSRIRQRQWGGGQTAEDMPHDTQQSQQMLTSSPILKNSSPTPLSKL